MRLTLVIVGMLFLFNPAINVIDPLPDFIGYLFIVAGLSRMSCLVDKLAEARSTFMRLCLVTAIKIISALFLLFSDDTLTLVMVFSFAVIELMCIFPAYDRFFEGLFYAGTRFNGTAVFMTKSKRIRITAEKAKALAIAGTEGILEETDVNGNNTYYRQKTVDRASSLKSYTLFFMTAKLVLNVLPELTALQLYDHIGSVSQTAIDYSQFKSMFLITSWVLTLALGIPWLIRITVYLSAVLRDKPFINTMKAKYAEEILPDKTRRIVSSMSAVIVLLSLGVISTFDLYIDHVNITPNFIAAVFMVTVFAILSRYRKGAVAGIVSASAWGIVSAVNLSRQIKYFDQYTLHMIFTRPEAQEMYEKLELSMTVEAVFGILTYILIAVFMIKVIGKHIDRIGIDHVGSMNKDSNREIRFCVSSRMIASSVLGGIASAAYAVYPFIAPEFDYAMPVVSGVQIVMIAYTLYSLMVIKDEVYKRLRGDY